MCGYRDYPVSQPGVQNVNAADRNKETGIRKTMDSAPHAFGNPTRIETPKKKRVPHRHPFF
jgi:hypothetical protein